MKNNFEALYFAILTFSTVGLGDYYPTLSDGASRAQWSLLYIMFGILVLLAMAMLSGLLGGLTELYLENKLRSRRQTRLASKQGTKSPNSVAPSN